MEKLIDVIDKDNKPITIITWFDRTSAEEIAKEKILNYVHLKHWEKIFKIQE